MIDEGKAEGTLEEAVALFRKAAAQNYSNSWVSLGVMQSSGRGIPRDYTAAIESYRTAARMGNAHEFNEIGVAILNGEGVAPDPHEALAWFIVAAAHGDRNASRSVGRLIDRLGESAIEPATMRANEIGREFGLLPKTKPGSETTSS
jgi:TPR repeat protein